jgi:hypothetical protein
MMSRWLYALNGGLTRTAHAVMCIPKYAWLRLAIVVASLALSAYWVRVDSQPPIYDEAGYLSVTRQYVAAMHTGGPDGLLRAIYHLDTAHAPLYEVALLPGAFLFGDSMRTALVLNLLLWPVLLVAVAAIADRLYDRRTGTLAMLLVATMPVVVGLSHVAVPDFGLIVLATLGVLCLLRTEHFSRAIPSAVCGVVFGLAWLTKVTLPALVIGPVLVVAGAGLREAMRAARTGEGRRAWSRVRNLCTTIAIGGTMGLLWYVPEFHATVAYIKSSLGTGLLTSAGLGPADPLTVHNIVAFTLVMVDSGLLLIYALVAVAAAIALFVQRLLSRRRHEKRPSAGHRFYSAAVVSLWVLIPYVSIATSRNQDVRQMAAAMPAMAVGIAALVSHIRPMRVRVPLTTAAAVAGVFTTVSLTWPVTLPGSPKEIAFATPAGVASYPLASQPVGYEHAPDPSDPMNDIMRYLGALENSRPSSKPLVVGVLESNPFIASGTLSYLNEMGGYGLKFKDVFYVSNSQLLSSLRACDVILYVPPTSVDRSVLAEYFGTYAAGRIMLVNQSFATDHMTPELLAFFNGPPRWFPLGHYGSLEVRQRTAGT